MPPGLVFCVSPARAVPLSHPKHRTRKGRIQLTTEVRGARPQEYPELISLLNDAFGNTDDESGVLEVLIRDDPVFTPDCVRVAAVDGRPVAMTVILPRRVRVRSGFVDGAELTLVGCRTALQGQGYGGLAVRDALAYLRNRGLALAVFYGEPFYYPRFGCAPVFPVFRAILPVNDADESVRATPEGSLPVRTAAAGLLKPTELLAAGGELRLESATEADIPTMNRLFRSAMGVYPGAIDRSDAPWEWHPRSDDCWPIRVLPDRGAYVMSQVIADRSELYVREAGAVDEASALRLLAALIGDARSQGLRQISANLPPDHMLHRAMTACGGDSLRRPASPGFAVIADWSRVLPEGYAVSDDVLNYAGRQVLSATTITLTQLAMGYLDIDDLALVPGCSVLGGDAARAQLRRDFPRLLPRYSWAPFYQLR